MGEFIEPYYNFTLGAIRRTNSNITHPEAKFGGGRNMSSTAASVILSSATESFYHTTLLQNSIPPGDGVDGEYLISDWVTASSSIGKSDSFNDNDFVDAGSNGTSPGSNNDFFSPSNRTLMISDLPVEYRVVDETAWPRIYAYFAVFIVSAIANFCELIWVCRRLRTRASPVNRLFLHLCIADLIVVFMVAAVEVLWRISIGWYAGNFMCKAVMFSRAFGLYLSSLMIICISLDRYYAVVYPLRVIDASHRVKIMLTSAWVTAAICALPQSIVFREETHPHFPIFHQCATIWMPKIERANSWLSITMMYFIPLGVIIFAYGSIIIKIAGYLGENRGDGDGDGPTFLRRNGMPVFQRAKLRTLKLTFMIVVAFVFCWTPYILISTWYLIDEKSATSLDGNIQDALFIMAVANSMANPLVYGFNESCKKRRAQNHLQDTYKEPDQRSEAVIMNNQNSCRCSHKTRVRFSTRSPQTQQSAV